jgi:hypothetical protein
MAQARQNSSRLLLLLVAAHVPGVCRKQGAGSLYHATADTVAGHRCCQCVGLRGQLKLSAWVRCALGCPLPARGPGTLQLLQLLHRHCCPVVAGAVSRKAATANRRTSGRVERRLGHEPNNTQRRPQLHGWHHLLTSV